MASSRLSYRARPVRTGLVGPVSRADPHRGGSGASPGGSPYWSLFGFLGALTASASPRSRIVFNDFWWLSRRERCLDNHQKSLRAAWIGVMQKDWITKGDNMPRIVARPREAVTQPVGCPLSVSPAGAVLIGSLSPWPSSLVPSCDPAIPRSRDT